MKAELQAMKASKQDQEEEYNKLQQHYEQRLAAIDASAGVSSSKSFTHSIIQLFISIL